MALTKLITDLIDGDLGGGTTWVSDPKTANFTAVAGEGYFVNTTSTAITVTLPSSPSAGDEVSIVDYAGTAATNNITITSSDNINGSSNDVFIDYERGGVSMVYVDATQGWIAYNAANETASALNTTPLTVDYLVVGGGGGGANGYGGISGGAGGGGGMVQTSGLNSTSGAGSTSPAATTLNVNTDYAVTVGGGGTGAVANTAGAFGAIGGSSTFNTTTMLGGGGSRSWGSGGQSYGAQSTPQAASGGGGTYTGGTNGSIPGIGSVATRGGNGGNGSDSAPYYGGGGGGAGDLAAPSAGSGQDGKNCNITGSNVKYSAGGGYSVFDGGGVTSTTGAGGNAPDNQGGGGGGGFGNAGGQGGNGGSGVVILRYPSLYSITVGSGITEASGSPFTEGTDKVSVFTGGTGNISFS